MYRIAITKTGSFYKEGFEHVEFVIDCSFDDFKQQYKVNRKAREGTLGYKECTFSEKAIHKKINPDISLHFGDCAVKFHQNSLEYVIMVLEKDLNK